MLTFLLIWAGLQVLIALFCWRLFGMIEDTEDMQGPDREKPASVSFGDLDICARCSRLDQTTRLCRKYKIVVVAHTPGELWTCCYWRPVAGFVMQGPKCD